MVVANNQGPAENYPKAVPDPDPPARMPPSASMPVPRPPPAAPRPGGDATLAVLSAAAMGGDQGAFEQIHRRLETGLRRQFMDRCSGKADVADDLSQRTWMAVWNAFQGGKYHPERAAISTFVYAVGVKVWLQHLRRNRRSMGDLPASLANETGDGGEPHGALKFAELLDAMREGLKSGPQAPLSDEERWIVQAASRGDSDRVLAKRLGVAASTLNVRKRAALEKLRRFLASRGHRPETGEREDDRSE